MKKNIQIVSLQDKGGGIEKVREERVMIYTQRLQAILAMGG